MVRHQGLLVETITNGPFFENCFLVADAESREAIVLDPGDEEERILERIRELELQVKQIVCTHGHIDHAGAVAPLKRVLGVPFAVHPAEAKLLESLPLQARMFGLPPKEQPVIDVELRDFEVIACGTLRAEVVLTPGHSPGGCCLYFAAEKVVFVGDTLFAGSIGRTDLPGGNADVLLISIRQRLLPLPDEVVVYSGHGPPTTIGAERRTNPFL